MQAQGAFPECARPGVRDLRDHAGDTVVGHRPSLAPSGASGGVGKVLRLSFRRGVVAGTTRRGGRNTRRERDPSRAPRPLARRRRHDHARRARTARAAERDGVAREHERGDACRRSLPASQNDRARALRYGVEGGAGPWRVRHAVLQRARRADRGRAQQCVRQARRSLGDAPAVVRVVAGDHARRDARRPVVGRRRGRADP